MNLSSDLLLFFLLSSAALIALDIARYPIAPRPPDYPVWVAAIALLVQPVAMLVANRFALAGDLTPFLAFDLIAAAAIAATVAGRQPGGAGFTLLVLLVALALGIGVQQLPTRGAGVTGPLMAALLLCITFAGAAAECSRHLRLHPISRRVMTVLAVLCGAGALLQLLMVLVAVGLPPNTPGVADASTLISTVASLWLLLKLLMISAVLTLRSVKHGAWLDQVARHLVQKANASTNDLLVVSQAFYQLPASMLVTADDGRILFASAQARRQLSYPDTTDRLLEDLFLAAQPIGQQQVRALFERPDRQAELVLIRMTSVECAGQSYHLMQLEKLPFDYDILRSLLVDSHNDAPHEASGLLDHHFAIAAMADGWFRLLDPIDRYAGAGVFWDKLRLLSDNDSEIAHLENGIASANEAHGWLLLRRGGGLSVSLRKMKTPDYKLFYRVQMTLVDDALRAGVDAPFGSVREARL
jgi:PAS domain-containing protein